MSHGIDSEISLQCRVDEQELHCFTGDSSVMGVCLWGLWSQALELSQICLNTGHKSSVCLEPL